MHKLEQAANSDCERIDKAEVRAAGGSTRSTERRTCHIHWCHQTRGATRLIKTLLKLLQLVLTLYLQLMFPATIAGKHLFWKSAGNILPTCTLQCLPENDKFA